MAQQVSMTTIKMGGTQPTDEESVRVLKAQAAQRREEYERQVAEAQQRLLQEQQLRRQANVQEQQLQEASQLFEAHQQQIQRLESEDERAQHRQAFVRQFHQLYPNIRNPYDIMHRLPEHHLGEEETLAKLALKQGSMMQFPKNMQSTKFDYFTPPEEPMHTQLGMGHDQHPDNCLPSLARQQQTYITHPSARPSKLEVRGLTPPPVGTPGHPGKPVGVRQAHWPPRAKITDVRVNFKTEGGPKSFQWPPPKQEQYRSCLDLGPPPTNGGSTQRLWNPSSMTNLNDSGAQLVKNFAPNRRQYQWPPKSSHRIGGGMPNGMNGNPQLQKQPLEEIVDVGGHPVVGCYRQPPWCQFYRSTSSQDDVNVQQA